MASTSAPLIHGHTAKEWLTNPYLFLEFCERFLLIRPAGGGKLIPLVAKPAQRWFIEKYVVPAYVAGEPVRANILKARQLGFSTIIEAWIYWTTLGHSNWESLVIGRDKIQARRTLFRMFKRFHDNFEEYAEFPRFPTSLSRQEEIVFGEPLHPDPKTCRTCGRKTFSGKCISCGTTKVPRKVVYLNSSIGVVGGEDAGDKLGRGGTYQAIHVSEAAFYPDLSEALSGLLAACHPEPQTCVFVETTANGFNAYYEFWRSAPSGWSNVFIPWYWEESYSRVRGAAAFVDEEEEELWKLMAADEEWKGFLGHAPTDVELWGRLWWRRHAIENICLGDVDKFHQEYPSTPAEAFRFSGQAVFSAAMLIKVQRGCTPPAWQGEVDLESEGPIAARAKPTIVRVSKGAYGRLSVWEDPQPLQPYLVAADVAEGRAAGNRGNSSGDYDYSAAVVFRITDGLPGLVHVATWHGVVDPDRFGFILVGLAKHYNNAMLNWEVNGPGAALKIQIMDICRYRSIYLREEIDTTTRQFVERPGWRTTRGTKPVAITALQRYVRSGDVLLRDQRLLEEMRAYQVTGPNQYEAKTGHDDLVISAAIACATADVHISGLLARAKRLRQKASARATQSYWDSENRAKAHPILGEHW